MEYQASEKLASILTNNGFSETTKNRYPKHFAEMQNQGYDPHSFKRSFSFGRKMSIIFDYIDIKSYGNFTSFQSYGLKVNELKSIFTFLNLPYHTQREVEKIYKNILNIADQYERICKNPEWRNGATDLRIRETFEKISI